MSGRHSRGSFRRAHHSFSSPHDRPSADDNDNQDQPMVTSSPTSYSGPSQSNPQTTYAYPPPPDPNLPPGKADLQTLETLKAIIKGNQHQYFRPIPNPQALIDIYEGPLPPEFAQSIPRDRPTTPTSPDNRSNRGQRPSDSRGRAPGTPHSPTGPQNVCITEQPTLHFFYSPFPPIVFTPSRILTSSNRLLRFPRHIEPSRRQR